MIFNNSSEENLISLVFGSKPEFYMETVQEFNQFDDVHVVYVWFLKVSNRMQMVTENVAKKSCA